MTPIRLIGLVVTVFVVTLPAAFLMHEGPSSMLPFSTDSESGQEKEDKDDPVVDILCLKALEQIGKGDFTKAIAFYTKAIERDPKYSFAYIGRGDAYQAKGDLDRAVADYDRAIRADPTNEVARARAEDARRERASQ